MQALLHSLEQPFDEDDNDVKHLAARFTPSPAPWSKRRWELPDGTSVNKPPQSITNLKHASPELRKFLEVGEGLKAWHAWWFGQDYVIFRTWKELVYVYYSTRPHYLLFWYIHALNYAIYKSKAKFKTKLALEFCVEFSKELAFWFEGKICLICII